MAVAVLMAWAVMMAAWAVMMAVAAALAAWAVMMAVAAALAAWAALQWSCTRSFLKHSTSECSPCLG